MNGDTRLSYYNYTFEVKFLHIHFVVSVILHFDAIYLSFVYFFILICVFIHLYIYLFIYLLFRYIILIFFVMLFIITPHAQRERGKVIGVGVHMFICLWTKKKFESYFSD